MLLIRCPYCETERPEIEFRYAGEAHIARPADPVGADRRRVGELPLHPLAIREGLAFRALASHARLRPLLQCRARHGHATSSP